MRLLISGMLLLSGLAAFAQADRDVATPTPVTLKLDDAPPQQVFLEIGRQAGIDFAVTEGFWEKSSQPINIDVSDQPFWLAVRDVCGKAGLSLKYETSAARPRILLSRDNPTWTQYPSVATGPFLVSLIGLQRTSTVDMRKPDDLRRSFIVRYSIFCEPRVRLLRGSLHARIDQAADDKGNDLAPPKDEAAPPEPMNFITSWACTLEGRLQYPAEAGAKIPLLRGSANFIAQTQSETINVAIDEPRAFKDVGRSVAGRKILFRELRRTADQWEAVVTFSRETLPPEEWERALFPGHMLRLIDAEGKFITARGFGLGGKAAEATFVFKFEKDGPRGPRIGRPVKLSWEIPTQTQDLPITFEFRDVPLP